VTDQRESLLSLVGDSLRPPERLLVSEWAQKYRRLTRAEGAAEPGPWRNERAPYLAGVMDALDPSDPCQRVIVLKGSQLGLTDAGNNWIGKIIDCQPSPILVVQSSEELQRRWASTRLRHMVRSTPALRRKVGKMRDATGGMQRGPASTKVKAFPGGYLIIGNARSASSLAQLPARFLMLDEVDRYPFDIAGEGDPVDIAEKRTSTYIDRKVYVISTPTTKGYSRIEAEWETSDKRFWCVPCPHCGTSGRLTWSSRWSNLVVGGDLPTFSVVWSEIGRAPADAALRCDSCHGLIEEHERAAMIREGEWVATAESDTKGFHISSIYSVIGITLGKLAAEFVRAKSSPTRLQVFVNTRLGEPWEERDADRVDEQTLLGRRHGWWQPEDEHDRPGVPVGVLLLTAGVDVQDSPPRIEVEVVGWGRGEESWSIDHRTFWGDAVGSQVWSDLTDYLRRGFLVESGGRMRIAATCLDTGHLAARCYAYVRAQQRYMRIFAVKGHSARKAQSQRPIWPKKPTKISKKKGGGELFVVNVDAAKDLLYAWLKLTHPGPAYPHHDHRWDADAFAQLTAEHRRREYVNGFPVRVWHKPHGRPNERLDLRVYNICALNAIYSYGRTIESFGAPPPSKPKATRKVDGGSSRSNARSQTGRSRIGSRNRLRGRRKLRKGRR